MSIYESKTDSTIQVIIPPSPNVCWHKLVLHTCFEGRKSLCSFKVGGHPLLDYKRHLITVCQVNGYVSIYCDRDSILLLVTKKDIFKLSLLLSTKIFSHDFKFKND